MLAKVTLLQLELELVAEVVVVETTLAIAQAVLVLYHRLFGRLLV
jgi:hypothetical protein